MAEEPRWKLGARAGACSDDLNTRYREYVRRLVVYVRMHHPDVSAEDVAQDAIERLWRHRNRIDPGRPIEPYLFTIANNVARDIRRGKRSESRAPLYLLNPCYVEAPEEHTLQAEDHVLVREALNAVRPADRDLIYRRHWLRMSCHELSDYLKLTETAARQRLSRAQRRCATYFKHLSPVVIPLAALITFAQREIRRLSLAPAAGALGVVAVAASIGTGIIGPHHGGDAAAPHEESIAAVPDPASGRDSSDALSGRADSSPDANLSPTADEETRRADAELPQDFQAPPSPLRHDVQVHPGTAEGHKQSHQFEVDTVVGPVKIEGERSASGPATLHPAYEAVTSHSAPPPVG